MRSVCTIWFLLIFCGSSLAQESNTSSLLIQAEDVLYSDPQEAVRIAEFISEKSNVDLEIIKASYILTRAYYMEGKYDQALKIGLKYSEEEFKGDTDTKIQLNMLLSKILKELDLDALSIYYTNKAKSLLSENLEEDTKNWVEGKTIQYAINKDQIDNTKISLAQLYKAKRKFKTLSPQPYSFQIGNVDLDIAEIHLKARQLDSAHIYLTSAFSESRKRRPGNYLEMKTLIDYGNLLFLKNNHTEAIDTLNSAAKIAQKFQNVSEQTIIFQEIATNYLALDNLKEFSNYNQKVEELNNASGDIENDAVNVAYNIFNSNINERYELVRVKSRWHLLILGGILLLLLLFLIFTKFRYRAKINQYRKFISFLEKRKEVIPDPSLTRSQTVRTLNVPKEAEDLLLTKLAAFENSLDYTKKDISLSRLALKFETNTKYLSETVNIHKEKNFNAYINELRISYIIDKLKNDPQYLHYKISYLAEESGFSSHSVFATVFKSVTGISPTTFIGILKKEQENPAA